MSPNTISPDTSRERLTRLLTDLDTSVPSEEAARLAGDVIRYSRELDRSFGRTTLPWAHNFMVNVGLKQKGLCYHYSDGLYAHLSKQNYPHFTFHLAGAHIGEYWREHNALVILPRKWKDFGEGVVVDPWRQRGTLYVSKVKDDSAYLWKHRPKRGCN